MADASRDSGGGRRVHHRDHILRGLSRHRGADGDRVGLHSDSFGNYHAVLGYLASTGRFNLLLAATAGAVGCNVGSSVAYAVGRYGGRPFVEKWGSYILIGRRDLDDADRFFARYGGVAVLAARLLPVIRTFIALPAGIARLPQLKFQIYTFVGSWPWCFALAYIGFKLGQKWDTDPRLHAILQRFDWLVLAAVAFGLVWFVWRHFRRARE